LCEGCFDGKYPFPGGKKSIDEKTPALKRKNIFGCKDTLIHGTIQLFQYEY
jgi:hypothetical protein